MASAAAFKTLQLRQFHELFLEKKTRADGRDFLAFRDVLATTDSIGTSDGSCLVKLGSTTCVAGLKATLMEPAADRPDEGFLNVVVDLPPICCNKFKENRQGTNDESQAASHRLREIIKESQCFDLKQLVIEEGKRVWGLDLQVICLDYDGNMTDCCLIAALGALKCGFVPEVTLKEDTEEAMDVDFKDSVRKFELASFPISCTFAVFEEEILADPTYEEEALCSGLISIVWNSSTSSLISVSKQGGTAISETQLEDLFNKAADQSTLIIDLLKQTK